MSPGGGALLPWGAGRNYGPLQRHDVTRANLGGWLRCTHVPPGGRRRRFRASEGGTAAAVPPDRAWLWIEARDYQRLFSYDMAACVQELGFRPGEEEDLPGFRLQESQGGGQAGVVKPVECIVQDQWRFRYEGPAHCQAQGQVQLVSGSIAAPDQGGAGCLPRRLRRKGLDPGPGGGGRSGRL